MRLRLCEGQSTLIVLGPPSHRMGQKALMAVFCLSVCPSTVCSPVCPVPDPKLRMEGQSRMIIGRKEAKDTGDPRPHLQIKRSKGGAKSVDGRLLSICLSVYYGLFACLSRA